MNKFIIILVITGLGFLGAKTYLIQKQKNLKNNIQFLSDNKQMQRLIPHGVNTTDKLTDIWELSFRSFEVDVYFNPSNPSLFRVGYDPKEKGVDLAVFLKSVPSEQIKKIWIDLKNLNSHNFELVLDALNALNDKLNIKNKTVLESGIVGNEFSHFSLSGWNTSYYLPTSKILDLIEENNHDNLSQFAKVLIVQTKNQNIKSISFNKKLQSFVLNYLSPNLDANIDYHTWGGPRLQRSSFIKKIKSEPLYTHPRVKTFLIKVKSTNEL